MADKQTVFIPLPLGGQFQPFVSGLGSPAIDPALIPEGKAYNVANFSHRAGRWETATTWTASNVSSAAAYAKWEDTANNQTLVLLVDSSLKIWKQNSFTFTDSGALTTSALGDSTNYRGRLFFADGLSAISAFDGSAVTSNALGGETLGASTLATFNDRVFLGCVRATVTNQLTVAQAYDPTTSWVGNNVTAEKITNGTTITGRITPTNATTASWYLKDIYTVAATTKDTFVRYWCDLRNTSAIYDVPVKIEVYYSQIWVAGATYAVGHIRVPTTAVGNGFRYRVTSITTGVAAGVEPVWPVTVGTTIVDGGVTWICDGTDAAGSTEGGVGGLTIYNTTKAPNFTRTSVMARVGANPQSTKLGLRVVFGNSANATYTLTSLEMSFRDGKADGTLSKGNYGQQLTVGRFGHDFFNKESSTSVVVTYGDRVYWTEVANTDDLRGSNFYRCQEIAGQITAIRAVGGRLVVFKKRGMWVFQGTADPDIPLRLEHFYSNYGCPSYTAIDNINDTLYFIGLDDAYSWTPGTAPKPIGNDAAREIVVGLGSALVPRLSVDATNQELLLSSNAQSGVNYYAVYSVRYDDWTTRTPPPAVGSISPSNLSICNDGVTFAFSDVAGSVVHYTISTNNSVNDPTAPFTATWTPRYIAAPSGQLLHVKRLWLRYVRAQGACTFATNVVYLSGTTQKSKTLTVTLPPTSSVAAVPIDVEQVGDSFQFNFTFTPTTSSSRFVVSRLEAECEILTANPQTTPTFSSGSLS
jgi:hypothetical protein